MKTKQASIKVYVTFLVVEGRGDFPFDMLRYDGSRPFREEDSHAMAHSERRRVILVRHSVNASQATVLRWQSFGWEVLAEVLDGGEALDVFRRVAAVERRQAEAKVEPVNPWELPD